MLRRASGLAALLCCCCLVSPAHAMTLGQEFLKLGRWAVIGDVMNQAKPAARVVSSLRAKGKEVHLVNPRDKSCHASLGDIGQPVDVVDLCINHREGLKQVAMCKQLGISKVFIQPVRAIDSAELTIFIDTVLSPLAGRGVPRYSQPV